MSQPYPVTDQPVRYLINGQVHEGRVWQACPLEIDPADMSPEAVAYRVWNFRFPKKVDIHALLGVRYGRADRWRPAVKVAPDAPADCTKWPPIPPQSFRGENRPGAYRDEWRDEVATDYGSFGTREGEDVLRMNLYRPARPAPSWSNGWPLMVWVPGGGGNYLSASQNVLRAQRAVAQGAMFAVLDYRRGTLGSYWHPDFEAEGDYIGGNFALTDIIAALHWVQDHIADFGGDPDKVTLGGSSFGGNATLALMAAGYSGTLFHQARLCSPSGGVQKRWTKELVPGVPAGGSFRKWFGARHAVLTGLAASRPDHRNPTRSLADAIADLGWAAAMRACVSLTSFMAMDGGGKDYLLPTADWATGQAYTTSSPLLWYEDELYKVETAHTSGDFQTDLVDGKLSLFTTVEDEASRSLTLINDGHLVTYPDNRTAARAGALPAIRVMVGCAQMEASAIGFGNSPHPYWREVKDLGNWTWAGWLATSGTIVDTNWNGSIATWSPPEVNRMAFNWGYYHTVREVAKAITAAGGVAYLEFGNYVSPSRGRRLCGHAWDVAYLFGNPHYAADRGELTAQDVRMSDGMVRGLVNFLWTGDPNIAVDTGVSLDLFETGWGQTWAPYHLTNRPWNILGNWPWRNASGCTAAIGIFNNYWDPAFAAIEARL